jgi:DNA transposition AAA+ family ATPase
MTDPALKKNPQSQQKARQNPDRRIDLWDKNLPFKDPAFVETTTARTIWGVLDHCHETPDMGLVIGASGIGKSRALQEYSDKEYSRYITVTTCSIATRSLGSIVNQLARIFLCHSYSNYETIESIVRHLSRFRTLLIFDDSHFLKWEQMELIRSFYDRAGCGVAFIGQETLYDKMIGSRKTYVWDQLISRIGVHYRLEPPTEEDVEMICRGIYPGLGGKCLRYLFNRAKGPGKLRAVTKLLTKAAQVHAKEGVPLDVTLLKKIDGFLTLKGGELLP